jgi:hypothetical protein
MGYSGDDVLITGGVRLTDWTSLGLGLYSAPLPTGHKPIRDLWVNGQRMIRARFPNVPACDTTQNPYAHPNASPCMDAGYLRVLTVDAISSEGQKYQRVTARTADGSTVPDASNWAQVEVSATRFYVNPHQRVLSGTRLGANNDSFRLRFGPSPITS